MGTPPSVPPSPPPPRESCEAIPPGENCEVCGQGVPPTEGMECHHYLWRMAGNTPGQRDGRGTRSRFYRPSGLAIDDRTRTVYIADTYNHRIRLIDLMDVPDVIVEDIEYWGVDWPLATAEPHLYHPALVELLLRLLLLLALLQILLALPAVPAKAPQAED